MSKGFIYLLITVQIKLLKSGRNPKSRDLGMCDIVLYLLFVDLYWGGGGGGGGVHVFQIYIKIR